MWGLVGLTFCGHLTLSSSHGCVVTSLKLFHVICPLSLPVNWSWKMMLIFTSLSQDGSAALYNTLVAQVCGRRVFVILFCRFCQIRSSVVSRSPDPDKFLVFSHLSLIMVRPFANADSLWFGKVCSRDWRIKLKTKSSHCHCVGVLFSAIML
jgi:hypothetical protein